jgi:uncharacterized protein YbjT (DUF2867 family)
MSLNDLRDSASLVASLKGIESVFYIAPAFIPGEAELGKAMVHAAIRAGVPRFVFSAVIHPVLSALVNHAAKVPVEEAVLTSELEYTFLHQARFFQNYAVFWPKVIRPECWQNHGLLILAFPLLTTAMLPKLRPSR